MLAAATCMFEGCSLASGTRVEAQEDIVTAPGFVERLVGPRLRVLTMYGDSQSVRLEVDEDERKVSLLRIGLPFRPTAIVERSEASFCVAGQGLLVDLSCLVVYSVEFSEFHQLLVNEEYRAWWDDGTLIGDMLLSSINGIEGVYCLELKHRRLLWVPISGSKIVKVIDLSELPGIGRMRSIVSSTTDARGHSSILLSSQDLSQDYLLPTDTTVVVQDNDEDGKADHLPSEK